MAGEFTTDQLADLTAKIADASIGIRHGDKSVQYADLQDMIKLRDRMIREMGGAATHRPSRHLVKFNRGDRR